MISIKSNKSTKNKKIKRIMPKLKASVKNKEMMEEIKKAKWGQ
jgi:hypothetical protein